MTDQLTDEYLEKRAEVLANEAFPRPEMPGPQSSDDAFHRYMREDQPQSHKQQGHKEATLSALKVHRDGLRFMQQADHLTSCALYVRDGSTPWRMGITAETKCSCGRDQHIASLRELLGVSQ